MRRWQPAAPTTHLQWYVVWALACVVLHLPLAVAKDAILAVKSQDVEPYQIALQAVQTALVRNGREIDLREYSLAANGAGTNGLLAEISARPPALILTIGSAATAVIQQQVQDVPVVFCMVLNPVASGFVSALESPGTNMTGASLDIPARLQFETLQAVVPSVKTVGVLYNPQETGEVVRSAAHAAAAVGLDLIAIPVTAAEKLQAAFDKYKKKLDALWAVADSTVFASDRALEFLLRRTLDAQIPFMGLSPSFVKAGALLALAADYRDVGTQCGEQAAQILAGRSPAVLPITVPRKVTLYLNLQVAKALGVQIPPRMMQGAVVLR